MTVPREKGEFVQAGSIQLYPVISGQVVSHNGTLALDTVHLQSNYPVLFEVIGTEYNQSDKGDNDSTQFRTPDGSGLPTVTGFEWRIRF